MLTKESLEQKMGEGLTVEELAKHFDCSTSSITRAKRRFDLALPIKKPNLNIKIPRDEFENLIRWGFTNEELAEFYECSVKPIKQKKKEWGLLGSSPNCKKEVIVDGKKQCTRCNTYKKVSSGFYFDNRQKTYYSICKSCWSQKTKNHYEQNKEYYAEKSARYRASLLAAVPEYYDELDDLVWSVMRAHCKDLEKLTGQVYEVDHIIPLSKGGLHHRSNWQILTCYENRSKGAKTPLLEI